LLFKTFVSGREMFVCTLVLQKNLLSASDFPPKNIIFNPPYFENWLTKKPEYYPKNENNHFPQNLLPSDYQTQCTVLDRNEGKWKKERTCMEI
jgi:hypothetical protein